MKQQIDKAITALVTDAVKAFGEPLQKAKKIELTLEQFTDYTRTVAMLTYSSIVDEPKNTHRHHEGGLYQILGVMNPAGEARHAGMGSIVAYRGADGQMWYRSSVEEFNKSFKPTN